MQFFSFIIASRKAGRSCERAELTDRLYVDFLRYAVLLELSVTSYSNTVLYYYCWLTVCKICIDCVYLL